MINFYQAWKDDKDSTPKKKKSRGEFKCPVCGKRTNSQKHHMDDAHGKGTYQKYLNAIEYLEKERHKKLLELMERL